ncbi:hypothetical protein RyT2_11730 [Pseudolactococcus yaeyamensis]
MKITLEATQYENQRIAIYARYGTDAEVGAGGRVDQLYNQDPATISKSANYLMVTELDILMAIENVDRVISVDDNNNIEWRIENDNFTKTND